MSHGPVMFDLQGMEITPEEREMLQHPAAGGIILFTRNYESPVQVEDLVRQIHAIRTPSLLVAVDQEGGRVQRFRPGFSPLPPAAWFGQLYDSDPRLARHHAQLAGWLMAAELRASGVDFSFAPVLDLDSGVSEVIGNRAYHSKPEVVTELALSWMQGSHTAGMASVGKHFPGHGGVSEDSHLELPVDHRSFDELVGSDLKPFRRMIDNGLDAVMPAHVIYEQCNPELAGFSNFWLQHVLRGEMNFHGVIFSDDLTMNAAHEAGDYAQRAEIALKAGCDMVLVCNHTEGAAEVMQSLSDYSNPASQMRLIRMHGKNRISRDQLHLNPKWKSAVEMIGEYVDQPTLGLN
jgi:beta-N-acetylhexosaminidase